MNRIVMFSGGVGSYLAARRIVDQHGTDGVVLLFADTLIEDPDLYRFLEEASADLGVPLTRIVEGRTPWDVFRDERFLGNSRVDPCSKILKRQFLDRWVEERFTPETAELVFGIGWDEEHRIQNLRERRAPWVCLAPMCDAPHLTKKQMLEAVEARGIKIPRLYRMGFSHNNCGGGCVKAGQAHFANLMRQLPEVYANWERNEQELRELLGDVSILKDRRGGTVKPMSLAEFRKRVLAGDYDRYEWGGCGCAV